MNWIYPTQLYLVLKKQIQSIYVLFGNDVCLLQDTKLNILKTINTSFCIEKLHIELNIDFNWDKIFNFCKTTTLFKTKKILSLSFPQDYPISFFNKNIPLLNSFMHSDLILIVLIYTSNHSVKYKTWMEFFNKNATFINCIIPKHNQLEAQIKNQATRMNLVIENLACQLLCYYYEGNNGLLTQTLQFLSLVYPDGNLSFLRVKNIINDSAFFDYNHWIESILTGKKKRANRILKQLECTNFNWKILLHKIQHEILIITQIKHSLATGQPLFVLFKKHHVYTQYHRLILSKSIQQFSFNQLHTVISLLVQMEIKHYTEYISLTKSHFEILAEILCNPNDTILNQQFFFNNII